jgi:hypothetical protein
LSYEVPHGTAAMCRQAVPDDEQLAGNRIGLLDKVGCERPTNRMQEGWSDVPTEHRRDKRRNEQQNSEDAQASSHASEDTHRAWESFPGSAQHDANHERKSTSSRWNIFTARNSAAAAYTQVEEKIIRMEPQW